MVHELKTWPEFFQAVVDGRKKVEVRLDDRGFAVGDTLTLREYDRGAGYTGRAVKAAVTHITNQYRFGLRVGYVAMSIAVQND